MDPVGADEMLLRSVGAKGWMIDLDGAIIATSEAFHDPGFRPSVTRAGIRPEDPEATKRAPDDGVAQLATACVRAIDPSKVGDRDQKLHLLQERNVDVVPDPIESNAAHALIVTSPQILKKNSAERRLRVALAQVANRHPWAIQPKHQRV